MDNDTLLKQVIRRLDVLIALQIETLDGPEAARPTTKINGFLNWAFPPQKLPALWESPLTMLLRRCPSRRKEERLGRKRNDE